MHNKKFLDPSQKLTRILPSQSQVYTIEGTPWKPTEAVSSANSEIPPVKIGPKLK